MTRTAAQRFKIRCEVFSCEPVWTNTWFYQQGGLCVLYIFAFAVIGQNFFNSAALIKKTETLNLNRTNAASAFTCMGANSSLPHFPLVPCEALFTLSKDVMHGVTAQLFPSFPPLTASPCCAAQTPCQQAPYYGLNYLKTAAAKSF